MPLVEGPSLAQLFEEHGRLTVHDCAALLAPLRCGIGLRPCVWDCAPRCQAQQCAAAAGHCAEPWGSSAALLGQFVVPRLVDFGIARALDAPDLTSPGRTIGTPIDMSPEQCADSHELDGRSDLDALGAIFYHALVGRPPFSGSTTQILHAHVYEPTLPESLLSALPQAAIEVLRLALAKAPESRYPNGEAMASALEQIGGEPLPAVRRQRRWRCCRRCRARRGCWCLECGSAPALLRGVSQSSVSQSSVSQSVRCCALLRQGGSAAGSVCCWAAVEPGVGGRLLECTGGVASAASGREERQRGRGRCDALVRTQCSRRQQPLPQRRAPQQSRCQQPAHPGRRARRFLAGGAKRPLPCGIGVLPQMPIRWCGAWTHSTQPTQLAAHLFESRVGLAAEALAAGELTKAFSERVTRRCSCARRRPLWSGCSGHWTNGLTFQKRRWAAQRNLWRALLLLADEFAAQGRPCTAAAQLEAALAVLPSAGPETPLAIDRLPARTPTPCSSCSLHWRQRAEKFCIRRRRAAATTFMQPCAAEQPLLFADRRRRPGRCQVGLPPPGLSQHRSPGHCPL
jgi:serine/threonine-protein kinase